MLHRGARIRQFSMGHPWNITGPCICIMSSVIALLSGQPVLIKLKDTYKLNFPSSFADSGEVPWHSSERWNRRKLLVPTYSHFLPVWNKEMQQCFGARRQKSHVEDGKAGRQKEADFLIPPPWALQTQYGLEPGLLVPSLPPVCLRNCHLGILFLTTESNSFWQRTQKIYDFFPPFC